MVNAAKKVMPPPPRPSTTSHSASDNLDMTNSPDMSDDEPRPLSAHSWRGKRDPSPADSGHSATESDEKPNGHTGEGASAPVQKRRRVTRACDECRRKKIKCDGKQPCTHCSVYSYECTYDKPSNRRRNPAPQYIEALENRLQRAELLLRKFIPDVDLSDPQLEPAVQQEFRNREHARALAAKLRSDAMAVPEVEDTQLLSMIESIGQLDLDEKGGWDFHGVSSGAVFLRRMKENFRGMLGPTGKSPFLPRAERPPGLINLDSPASAGSSPFDSSTTSTHELPPKELARSLCYYSLNCATCLIRIVHAPSFWEMFERVYEKPVDHFTNEEHKFLGLLYATMALGCMYNNLDDGTPSLAYKQVVEEGLKYYDTARRLLQDITECRDLTSLQALLFMILFLQATSNLSGCYAFIGIALRSALRMGLHRHLQHEQISLVEQEVRRRVFYVIRQMDIYVSAMLGFPLLLNKEDIDQPYPTEVDDEYITKDAITPPPPGAASFYQAFNAHTRLMEILAKIIKYVYPLRGLRQSVMKGDTPGTTYLISHAAIKEIEAELQEWYEVLPAAWRPSQEGPIEAVRVRHLLRFAYAHVQLLLYRPFLHYVSPRLSSGKKVDELSYACAAAGISVSRNIVHIGIEIRKQGVLAGPYWFMLYTEFFAVLSLVFYATENPEKLGSAEVLSDAKAGRDMVFKLRSKSQAAERVSNALKVLFDKLPEKFDETKPRPLPTKKRSAPGPRMNSTPMRDHQGMAAAAQAQRRSEDAGRPPSGTGMDKRMGQAPMRSSFDEVSIADSLFQDPGFSAVFQDMLPLDLSSRATPESTSTGGSASHQATAFPGQPLQGHNPIHKLDELMFPSEDPFAYPNQPMMELGYQQQKTPDLDGVGGSSQIFMQGAFDDLDSQLMGQGQAFLAQQAAQQQQGLDLSQLYRSSGMMGGMPQAQQAQHRMNTGGRAPLQRMSERELQQMLVDTRFQGDWANVFGRGTYQGLQ